MVIRPIGVEAVSEIHRKLLLDLETRQISFKCIDFVDSRLATKNTQVKELNYINTTK